MLRKQRRGNLLLMAVFMSVFLFFLSVALVATNRQDLRLAIFIDNHLRAQTAARAGANFALETMQIDPQWETTLLNKGGTMISGAKWKVDVAPYLGPDGTPNLLKIHSHGSSGFLGEDYSIIVEEFRLADSIARQGLKPQLFILCNQAGDSMGATPSQLLALTPAMKWQWLAYLNPAVVNVSTMCGAGGPMFVCRTGTGSPPIVQDYSIRTNSYVAGQPVYSMTPITAKTGFQTGMVLDYLDYEGSALTWNTAPDPDTQLRKFSKASIDASPVDEVPPPKPRIEVMTLGLTKGVPVDVSAYQGPVIDHYCIVGTKAAAEGPRVYVHATHSIYVGQKTRNLIEGSGQAYTQAGSTRPSQVQSAPCVLCFDTNSKSWSKIMDPFDFNGIDGSYPPYLGLQPVLSTMAVTSGGVFALNRTPLNVTYPNPFDPATITISPVYKILQVDSKRFIQYSQDSTLNTVLVGYNKAPRLLTNGLSVLDSTSTASYSLEGLPAPINSFANLIPDQQASLYDSGTQKFTPWMAQHQRKISTTPTFGPAAYAVANNDLWTLGQVLSSPIAGDDVSLGADGPPPVEQEAKNNTAFMHYDGTSWQVLPNGLHDTLYDPNAEGVGIVIHDQASGTKYIAQFNTTIMALLGFASPIPLQRRYQPLQVIR